MLSLYHLELFGSSPIKPWEPLSSTALSSWMRRLYHKDVKIVYLRSVTTQPTWSGSYQHLSCYFDICFWRRKDSCFPVLLLGWSLLEPRTGVYNEDRYCDRSPSCGCWGLSSLQGMQLPCEDLSRCVWGSPVKSGVC